MVSKNRIKQSVFLHFQYIHIVCAVSLKFPSQPEVIEERKLVDDVVGGSIDVENVLVVIEVCHGEAEFEGVARSEEEFFLCAEVEAMVVRQPGLVEIG